MKRKTKKLTPLEIAAHVGSLIPLLWMLTDLLTHNYGPDPIREFTLRTGKTALILLLVSLACTPVYILFKYSGVLKLRKPLGMYSFLYASLHFAIFIGLDYFFDLRLIGVALFEKYYALVGLSAGIILLILALTGNTRSQKRMKKNWKKLHSTVYAAGVLAVIHYILIVKQGVPQPWIYGFILLILLILRLNPVRKWVGARMSGVQAKLRGL
ncbi:MAG: sulfoxide reductase heme-binding subunit YedZ [Anaerolineaceae bacterium]|nr:sulfoxide reductase heme-binding subunit YedZ [Anaerolineaceae bacterium]